jgi:hypothetical protein
MFGSYQRLRKGYSCPEHAFKTNLFDAQDSLAQTLCAVFFSFSHAHHALVKDLLLAAAIASSVSA